MVSDCLCERESEVGGSRCHVSRADSIREQTVMDAESTTHTHTSSNNSVHSVSALDILERACNHECVVFFPLTKKRNLKVSPNIDATSAASQFGSVELRQSHKELCIIQQWHI